MDDQASSRMNAQLEHSTAMLTEIDSVIPPPHAGQVISRLRDLAANAVPTAFIEATTIATNGMINGRYISHSYHPVVGESLDHSWTISVQPLHSIAPDIQYVVGYWSIEIRGCQRAATARMRLMS
jgi:hypothetical protein